MWVDMQNYTQVCQSLCGPLPWRPTGTGRSKILLTISTATTITWYVAAHLALLLTCRCALGWSFTQSHGLFSLHTPHLKRKHVASVPTYLVPYPLLTTHPPFFLPPKYIPFHITLQPQTLGMLEGQHHHRQQQQENPHLEVPDMQADLPTTDLACVQ